MMLKVTKVIENPEVPGLECFLPPPPVRSTTTTINAGVEKNLILGSASAETSVGFGKSANSSIEYDAQNFGSSAVTNSNDSVARAFESPPVFPIAAQNLLFVPAIAKQPLGVDQPWWIPNYETDTNNAEYTPQSCLDGNALGGGAWIPDPVQKNISVNNKTKGKFLKRKSESIDPAQDADRVANAQRELSALMKPLKCDLCNAVMNSTLQAKLHYDGKPHQKKVSMFLNQSVKKPKVEDGQVTSTTSNTDWNTYCEVCKTWFTSLVDASQHYAGKKHIRATTGLPKPQTKKPQAPQGPVDPTGRFGIGVSFLSDDATMNPESGVPATVMPVATAATSPTNPSLGWPYPTFHCELCGVTANRLEQLETHKRGARHLRMLKMSGLANPDVDVANSNAAPQAPSPIDYSIYRTPSGQYYCAPCNRSFHSENSIAHHIESKKHKVQTNPKQPTPPPLPGNKKANKSFK